MILSPWRSGSALVAWAARQHRCFGGRAPPAGRLRAPGARTAQASVVVEDLARRIISGSLPAGAPLPTEEALCREFGFSRTVMREGLKLLEERRLVRVEQGRGTTVEPREHWNLLDADVLRIALEYDEDMALIDDLVAVRRVLEGQMARSAAARLTDEELAALARQCRADGRCGRRLLELRCARPWFPSDPHACFRERDRHDDRRCDP